MTLRTLVAATVGVLLLASLAQAQTVGIRGTPKGTSTALGVTSTAVDANRTALDTNAATTSACEDQTNSVCRTESQFEYETVAASQTNQVIGGVGATGDLVHSVVCIATAASAAPVTLKDGSGTAFNILHTFGAVGTFTVTLNMVSTLGAWQLTTSTNTTCIVIGRFS